MRTLSSAVVLLFEIEAKDSGKGGYPIGGWVLIRGDRAHASSAGSLLGAGRQIAKTSARSETPILAARSFPCVSNSRSNEKTGREDGINVFRRIFNLQQRGINGKGEWGLLTYNQCNTDSRTSQLQ